MAISCEQEARELLAEMQIENAQSMTAGELGPLADLINKYRSLKVKIKMMTPVTCEMLFPATSDLGTNKSDIIKTATAHWDYVGSVLEAHGITSDSDIYNVSKFHYITAFEHGWKHGVEDMKENGYIFSEGKR